LLWIDGITRGGFREGVRGMRPSKIRKAYMLINVIKAVQQTTFS